MPLVDWSSYASDGDESLQDDIFDFEQRLDNLREEIKDYALWLGEEEEE